MKLYLDSVEITDRVKSWQIVWDRSAPHNLINVQCNDITLWTSVNPDTNPTNARLKAVLGTVDCYFLLEKREGSEYSFTFGGRSLSARETGDHTDRFYGVWDTMYLDNGSNVLAAINSITATQTVVWSGSESIGFPQYLVFSGYPIDCLAMASEYTGCLVRGQDSGDIHIVKKYPFSPLALQTQTPDLSITDDDIILDFTPSFERGLKYDNVLIKMPVYDEAPDIVIEEGPNEVNTDWVYIRVYFPEVTIFFEAETYTSHGTLELVSHNQTASHTETVTFTDGQASVSHRISSYTSTVWHGASGGTVLWTEGQKELRITDPDIAGAIATVTYVAKYERYRLWSTTEQNVIFGFRRPVSWFVSSRPVHLTLTGSAGTNAAPPVDGELASVDKGAVALYDSYDKHKLSLKIDMAGRTIRDGDIIAITSTNPDVSGYNYFVEKCTANINEISTIYDLECVRWSR